ncbi:MAG: hypothetical protein AAF371_17580 [Pseudomonadota bacterium]
MNVIRLTAAAALAAFAIPFLAAAQDSTEVADVEGVSGAELAASLSPRTLSEIAGQPDRFRQRIVQSLMEISPEGTVTREMLDLAKRYERAGSRARHLLNTHFVADLDGDSAVTTEERSLVLGLFQRGQGVPFILFQNEADTDGDGTVSLAEAVALAEIKIATQRNRRRGWPFSFDAMALDLNDDGSVTVDEALEAFDLLVAATKNPL